MKFAIDQESFTKALTAASKSLSSRVNLPILSNILLSVTKTGLEVLTTDLETATRVKTDAKVSAEGKAAVPGRVLLEFISQIPGGEVSVEKLGEELIVSAASFNARLATMPPEDFPVIPKIEQGRVFSMRAGEFLTAVSRVAFCAAADESRPILTGILCEIGGGSVSMVATDGYRLGYQKIATSGKPGGGPIKVNIPAKALVEVAKLIAESGETRQEDNVEMEIAQTLNQANFKIANVEFTTRLIEGSFPPWQKIIPEKFATGAVIDREELMRVIRVASIFARDSGSIVKFRLMPRNDKPSVLVASAGNKQVGSNEAEVEIELSGKGGEIAFNYRYLLDMLASVSSEDVTFEMIESLNPGKITVPGDGDYFYIVMPVRLQS